MACDSTLSLCVAGLISGLSSLAYCLKLSMQFRSLQNGKNK